MKLKAIGLVAALTMVSVVSCGKRSRNDIDPKPQFSELQPTAGAAETKFQGSWKSNCTLPKSGGGFTTWEAQFDKDLVTYIRTKYSNTQCTQVTESKKFKSLFDVNMASTSGFTDSLYYKKGDYEGESDNVELVTDLKFEIDMDFIYKKQ